MLSSLTEIARDNPYYDEDLRRPTDDAVSLTRQLLVDAEREIAGPLPEGTIYADGDGGIRIEWIRPQKELRLVIRNKAANYIYRESPEGYFVEYEPTATSLCGWLKWLAGKCQPGNFVSSRKAGV